MWLQPSAPSSVYITEPSGMKCLSAGLLSNNFCLLLFLSRGFCWSRMLTPSLQVRLRGWDVRAKKKEKNCRDPHLSQSRLTSFYKVAVLFCLCMCAFACYVFFSVSLVQFKLTELFKCCCCWWCCCLQLHAAACCKLLQARLVWSADVPTNSKQSTACFHFLMWGDLQRNL